MKKFTALAALIFLLSFTTAYAEPVDSTGRPTPWDSSDIKINVVETFSEFSDGEIVWDKEPFWTGTSFYEWPGAKWKNGRLLFTDFSGLNDGADTRMTFRITTEEMGASSATGSTGIGFYVENNTANPQSIGFYMIGAGCCLKSKNNSTLYFISTSGARYSSVVTDSQMAVIPPGEKGYVLAFYEDFTNLWSSDAYDVQADPIKMPGFELTNLLVDPGKGESVVIDNVFLFGEGCKDNNDGLINVEKETLVSSVPTSEPLSTTQSTLTAVPSATTATDTPQNDNTVLYITLSAAVLLAASAAAALILRRKPVKKDD